MNSKGYIYTIVSVMLAILLLAVVLLYYDSYKSSAAISPAKLRTDELHYLVESINKDLSRALSISGRRGAIYLSGHVGLNGTSLDDSQENLRELILNATLTVDSHTTDATYMENHTMNSWINQSMAMGALRGYAVNMTITDLDVYAFDSWNYLAVLRLDINISDETSLQGKRCMYEKQNETIYSLVSLTDIEDPLYPLNTDHKIRYYLENSNRTGIEVLATGSEGEGFGGGELYNAMGGFVLTTDDMIREFNASTPELVPYTVFMTNLLDFDSELTSEVIEIVERSQGIINVGYPLVDIEGRGIPYIANVSTFTNTGKNHALIRNWARHEVVYLNVNKELQNGGYRSSINGSCFFDRLEGRYTLSEKYVNQSRDARSMVGLSGEVGIGLESFVNVTNFDEQGLYATGVLTEFTNQSSLDYLYFRDFTGTATYGTPYWFMLHPQDLKRYNLSTYVKDVNVSGVWHLDEGEGERVYSSTRSPVNGTVNEATWTVGKLASALSFDGIDDYVNISMDVSETAYTMSLWFKTTKKTCGVYSVGNLTPADDPLVDRAIYLSSGNIHVRLFNEEYMNTENKDYADGTWHHIAHVFGGDVGPQRLYVDGVLNVTGTLDESNLTLQDSVYLGFANILGYNEYFQGQIDEVKIWDRALSEDEIWAEYQLY